MHPPKFIQPIQGNMVEEGQKVVIRGVFEASPEPNVLWFHNQIPVRPSHDVKIEVGNKETSISFTKVCNLSNVCLKIVNILNMIK
jgi:hypothetical protein